MRTTVTLDDDIFGRAQEITGISEKAEIVRFALRALVESEAARRMRLLCGDPDPMPLARRRSGP